MGKVFDCWWNPFFIQWVGVLVLPDPFVLFMEWLLGRSNVSVFTGFEAVGRALIVIWKASGIGLLIFGVVGWVGSRKRFGY